MTEKNLPTTPEESQDVEAPVNAVALASTNSFISEKTLTQAEQMQAVQVLMKVSAYTGAKSHTVDEFLGTAVPIIGCISQPINLGHEVVDKETGEVTKVYTPDVRTIFLMENKEVISFVSKAASSFSENFLYPVFGRGDWSFPVKIKFTQISKGQGRTFNFQIVG
jgi:hypothetical protein